MGWAGPPPLERRKFVGEK
jgi:hypothetical protein